MQTMTLPTGRLPMSVQSLFLVTLVVDDYDRAKAFYCDLLGFDCPEDLPLPDGKRWVVVRPTGGDGAALLLAEATDDRQRAAIGSQTGGRVGFFLKTDDFARDHAVMIARGVRFLEAPRHEAYGTVAVFADPYGNTWDLIEHAAR
jgi:catechol 2,3-dioxygenase-like lactoylglutathione lyase family enzyme